MSKRRPSSSRKKSQKSVAKDLASLTHGGLLDEALAVSFLALAVFLCVSFISFEVSRASENAGMNLLGPLGHFTGTMLAGFFGWCALVPVFWALLRSLYWWGHDEREERGVKSEPISVRGVLVGLAGLLSVIVSAATMGSVVFGERGGGLVGQFIAQPLIRMGNTAGAALVALAFLLFSASLASRLSVVELVARGLRYLTVVARFCFVQTPLALLKTLGYLHRSIGSGMRGISARTAEVRRVTDVEPERSRRSLRERDPVPMSAAEDGVPVGLKAKSNKSSRDPSLGEVASPVSKIEAAVEKEVVAATAPSEEPFSHVVVKRREVGESRAEVKKIRKVEPPEPDETPSNYPPYELPDVALLTPGEPGVGSENDDELLEKSRQIESKLRDFSILGKVTQVHPGPVITLFEFEPAPGVKVGKIAALQDDLAMSLRASSIRIIAPIPKRGTVGIEVPNKNRDIVRLRDCLESEAFLTADSALAVAIGKDTYGDPVVVDIATMPHLLMAGATGTGKSVCINTLLLSLLYRASPEELGLILIDPKILELSIYEDIPHLRVPVVTVPRQAKAVLEWAVNEMNRRYRLMQKFGVRNIDGYNRVVRGDESPDGALPKETEVIELSEAEVLEGGTIEPALPVEGGSDAAEEEKADFHEKLEPLPKIVIVIDELADLMLTVGRDIEELITRLAQKARASGIHLILATQRPSVDVITGLIKANFPARLSFRVSSRIDSRTILDSMGAEKLLGRGDMLFMAPGAEALKRVHGAFVSDAEVKRVMDALKKAHKPRYDQRIIEMCDKALVEESENSQTKDLLLDEDEYDAIYDRALELVMEKGQASTSMLQRAFRIGYNRAARIIDMMEREGVVGPMDGAKPRDVIAPRGGEEQPEN